MRRTACILTYISSWQILGILHRTPILHTAVAYTFQNAGPDCKTCAKAPCRSRRRRRPWFFGIRISGEHYPLYFNEVYLLAPKPLSDTTGKLKPSGRVYIHGEVRWCEAQLPPALIKWPAIEIVAAIMSAKSNITFLILQDAWYILKLRAKLLQERGL